MAGNASINNAIELVRKNLRLYQHDIYSQGSKSPETDNSTLLPALKKQAGIYFPVRGEKNTPIKKAEYAINAQIISIIYGCSSMSELIETVIDLIYSVTFDLSAKATRESTNKMLGWERAMRAAQAGDADAEYEQFLKILD